MIRQPPRATRTDTLVPSTKLVRSVRRRRGIGRSLSRYGRLQIATFTGTSYVRATAGAGHHFAFLDRGDPIAEQGLSIENFLEIAAQLQFEAVPTKASAHIKEIGRAHV